MGCKDMNQIERSQDGPQWQNFGITCDEPLI
jgi:hypothetical protein